MNIKKNKLNYRFTLIDVPFLNIVVAIRTKSNYFSQKNIYINNSAM